MSEPPPPDRAALGRAAVVGGLRLRRVVSRIGEALDREGRRREAGFAALRRRYYLDYWRRCAQAVGAVFEELGRGFVRIRRGDQWTIVRGERVPLDDPVSLALAGDKPLSSRLLAEGGLPTVPQIEFTLATLDEAEAALSGWGGPCVVKPAFDTGGGHGVTTGVDSRSALRSASAEASRWCPSLILEPQWSGHSVRLLFLEGRLIDAVRRDPPCVTGDGRRSVIELMAAETDDRLEGGAIRALSPLSFDLDARATLRAAGWSAGSVVPPGRRVQVKRVVNQNSSSENHRVVDLLHPSLVELGRSAAAGLGLDFAGVDLMVDDLALPASEGAAVVGEVNTTPALHHHALVEGHEGVEPVGPRVIEHLLARGRPGRAGSLEP